MAATWPFQLEQAIRTPGESTTIQYQGIGAETLGDMAATERPQAQDFLRLVRHIALLSVLLLIPVLLISGELGYIYRNCYFLGVTDFWVFLFAGGAFRAIFFVSTILLIRATSALNTIVLLVLVNVSQVAILTYDKLLSLQWLGLIICLVAGVIFFSSNSFAPRPTLGEEDDASESGWSRQTKNPFRRSRLSILAYVVGGVFFITIVGRIFYKSDTGQLQYTSPILPGGEGSDRPLLRGTDAYLGQRPQVNAVADLNLLIQECRGSYERMEYVRDVHRCLEFLSSKEDVYLSIPETPTNHPEAHPANRSTAKTSGDRITPTNQSTEVPEICAGPIIPYHVWWTGLPTWRVELFIKSYLYTQNLACSRLWILINVDHHPGAMEKWVTDPRFQRFLPLVERGDIILKKWCLPARVPLSKSIDPLDKARYYHTPKKLNAEGEMLVADAVIRDASGQEWLQLYQDGTQLTYFTVGVSDAARLIILHLHGGVYLDFDMLLLRDLRPLILPGRGFAERWGSYKDPGRYNNALVSLPANSSLTSYILRGGTRMGLVYHFQAIGRMLYLEGRDDKDDKGLIKWENSFFDPMWVEDDHVRQGRCSVPCLPAFEKIFESAPIANEWESFDGEPIAGSEMGNNRTMENFYRGAWAYHIHNQVGSFSRTLEVW
jgi:hypothetical protein